MADQDQMPWDADTDVFVSDISATTMKDYNIDFRKLLLTPSEYQGTSGIAGSIKNIKVDVESYFDDLKSQMGEEEKNFAAQLEKLDALHTQVNQTIASRAAIARVPFIKPAEMDLSTASSEVISIDQYSAQLDLLITKLINSSTYVADLTATYRKYSIGAWFFSGQKNCMVVAKVPDSPVITIDNGHDIISALLDNAEGLVEAGTEEEEKKPEKPKK